MSDIFLEISGFSTMKMVKIIKEDKVIGSFSYDSSLSIDEQVRIFM